MSKAMTKFGSLAGARHASREKRDPSKKMSCKKQIMIQKNVCSFTTNVATQSIDNSKIMFKILEYLNMSKLRFIQYRLITAPYIWEMWRPILKQR